MVKAFVVIASDRGELTEQDLIAWCAERLVDYKVPVAIEILDALPKTGPGKIDKLALKGAR